jgi:vancomycin permeability regulator SanA
MRHLNPMIKRIALFALLILLLATAAIVIDGLVDDVAASDVAVVLGSKVELNGQPSARLQARLDRALALYQARITAHIIVSGGTGIEGFDEGQVMRDYLVAHGVAASAILTDSQGNNTEATAQNCARLMQAHGFKSVIIVTQYFHIPRTRLALHAYGIQTVHSAHARFFEGRDLYSTAREVVAIPQYWISLHLGHGLAPVSKS